MGFLSRMIDKGRAPRLWADYRKKVYPVLQQVKAERMEAAVMTELAHLCGPVKSEIEFMSIKGRKDFAWQLQLDGLSEVHSNVPRGLARWITGAMIEASFVDGAEAAKLRTDLEQLTAAIAAVAKQIEKAPSATPPQASEPSSTFNSVGATHDMEKKKNHTSNKDFRTEIDSAFAAAQDENSRQAERIRKNLGLD